ncbi:MAG: FMN-binding protein [Bacteroidales bacterium]|nr:FMN-binding protein [Bacteroidales bacterium]
MKKTNSLLAFIAIAVAMLVPFKTFAHQTAVPQPVVEMFPAAATVDDLGALTAVKDNAGAILGYYAYSKPASDSIQGFNGETPLLVVFDKEKKVQKVVLLDNNETPGFVNRVVEGGLFDAWNGLTIDQALETEVDAVSGATFTSNGVKESLKACLQNIKASETADKCPSNGCCCCTTWCIVGGVALLAVVCCVVMLRRKRSKK